MIKSVVLSIAIAVSLSSCVKEEDDISKRDCPGACTVVKGRFTTAGGREGMGNVPLEVKWKNVTPIFLSDGTIRRKALGRTDADGFYELRFLIKDDELTEGHFDVEASVDEARYLVYQKEGVSFSVPSTRDTTIIADYLVPRKAFIDAVVTNPGAVNLANGDYFGSSFHSQRGLNAALRSGSLVSWYGYQPNQQFTIEVAADQELIIETLKTKDKVRSVTYDTLQIPAGTRQSYSAEF